MAAAKAMAENANAVTITFFMAVSLSAEDPCAQRVEGDAFSESDSALASVSLLIPIRACLLLYKSRHS